jgi:mitochondrial fission protein ELM1
MALSSHPACFYPVETSDILPYSPSCRPTGKAVMALKLKSLWLISDGKAGDINQLRAVAAQLGCPETAIVEKIIRPRTLFALMAPWGPCDGQLSPLREGHALSGPWPDMILATGRRTVPVIREFFKARGPRPFTVFLKNPRISPDKVADCVWCPDHDRVTGPNVVSTLMAPVKIDQSFVQKVRDHEPDWVLGLPHPRLSVILGGPAGQTRYTPQDARSLVASILARRSRFQSVIVTTSRRTPDFLAQPLIEMLAHEGIPHRVYHGQGDNPYPDMLGLCSSILVTGDSHNMVSEAFAAGVDVQIFRPSRLQRKMSFFLDRLENESRNRKPAELGLNQASEEIAGQILARWQEWCHIGTNASL